MNFSKKHPILLAVFLSAIFFFPFNILSQWVFQVSGSEQDLYCLHFIDENTGFIGSASSFYNLTAFHGGEILRTTNGGNNWSRVLFDSNFRVKSFTFINHNTGYAVGGSLLIQGYLYKTTNSGINWANVTPAEVIGHFYNLQFVNASTAFLGMMDGIYRSTNSGSDWQRLLYTIDIPPGNFSWRKLFFIDENTGFFASDSGIVRKTTNSGLEWTVYYLRNDLVVKDITFNNAFTGFITGEAGILYRTTNCGVSWSELPIGTNSTLYSVKFPNQFIGYIAAEGRIYKTYNSGANWQGVFEQNSDSLIGAYFVNPDVGYVAGKHGKVYKTTSGGVIGIDPISGEIPKEYSLSQNYPNPFNPSTVIKFSIPKSSAVKLAVYDMLGREVEQLVNEQLTAGNYEVSWNAGKFSSGIYLYKLTSNDFQMVKKMSLIK
jgi:photosystem II stability/assembly factor-like uncharacterized protein